MLSRRFLKTKGFIGVDFAATFERTETAQISGFRPTGTAVRSFRPLRKKEFELSACQARFLLSVHLVPTECEIRGPIDQVKAGFRITGLTDESSIAFALSPPV